MSLLFAKDQLGMRVNRINILLILVAIVFFWAPTSSQQYDMWVTAYYPVWSLGVTNGGNTNPMYPHQMNWDGITHLVHFAVGPDSTPPYWHPSTSHSLGSSNVDSLEMFYGWQWRSNTDYHMIDSLRVYAHRNNTKLLLSVGGIFGDQARVMDYITRDTSRTMIFVDAVIGFVARNGYDGVEIDYEPPQSREAMSLLTTLMRQRLTETLGSSAPLAVAVTNLSEFSYDIALVDSVTQYLFMMYDMHHPYVGIEGPGGVYDVTGYNAPLHLPDSSQYPILGSASLNYDGTRPAEPRTWGPDKFAAMGFPKNKIAVGIPFFGYVFDQTDAPNQASAGLTANYLSYRDVLSFLDNGGTRHWDNSALVPWAGGLATTSLGWVITNGHRTFVTYDDSSSVREKVRWAKARGFGGMMVYELWSGWNASSPEWGRDPLLRALVAEVKNHDPIVHATVTPASGYVPLAVTLHASGSTDPDGDSLSYRWFLGRTDIALSPDTVYTFTHPGIDTLTVTVTDEHGGRSSASFRVVVEQSPSVAGILHPINSSFFTQGDTVQLEAAAVDSLGLCRWDVDLGYGDSFLESQLVLYGRTNSFVARTIVNDGGRYHFRIRFSVTLGDVSVLDTTSIYPTMNLRPVDISFDPVFPAADSSFRSNVKIKNLGDAGTSVASLKIFEGGILRGLGIIPSVLPGDSLVVTVSIDGLVSGPHTLTAVADAGSQVFETNELDNELTGNVTLLPHRITAFPGSHGTIYPGGTTTVQSGGNVHYSIQPDSNYRVGTITIDGGSVIPDTSFTFVSVNGDHIIAATFAIVSYVVTSTGPLSIDLNGNGMIDMALNFSTLVVGGGSIEPQLIPVVPVTNPHSDPSSPLCYLEISSTIPNYQFAAHVSVDMSSVEGFDSTSVLMSHDSTASTWVMVPGVYKASNPEFYNHPTFEFDTDHFEMFAFFNGLGVPKDIFVSPNPNNMEMASFYPDSSWRIDSPSPPTYFGTDDWSWTADHKVSVYIVPEVGSKFESCNLTVGWDDNCIVLDTVDFGSTGAPNGLFGSGHSYGVLAARTLLGGKYVTLTGERLDSNNFAIIQGDYIARLDFRVIKPGHSSISIVGSDFKFFDSTSTLSSVLIAPRNAIVKAYLGDFALHGSTSSGDGAINFEDLFPWSLSYWSGMPGFGMERYKVKYDIGPTQDGFVFSKPVPDGRIDFEDLAIFCLSYGLYGNNQLPKVLTPPSQPITAFLGEPQHVGSETLIPLIVSGDVNDLRSLSIQVAGQFGEFLGVEKCALLQRYTSPVMLMHRSQGRTAYVDLAIAGIENPGVSEEGEVVMLRFTGVTNVQLQKVEARNSLNRSIPIVNNVDGREAVPGAFALYQNYPNPFNPTTTIRYDLPVDAQVSVKVFNLLGQEVVTLVNEEQKAGYKSVVWNAFNVSSGVYYYRLQAGEYLQTKKLLILK